MKSVEKHISFDYTVRISRRAKRLQIQINPFSQVQVVLPEGMEPERIPSFLEQHRDWIMKTRARQLVTQAGIPQITTVIPEQIYLRACDTVWHVSYQQAHENHLSTRGRMGERAELLLSASDEYAARHLLQRWLTREAKRHLVPWLASVSQELGLSYSRVSIRAQRTRWGSCSSSGGISLNRALVFLEPELVRYLFVHELCHTVHLNHSRRYWDLVAHHEADFRRHERVLGRATTRIPRWAIPILGPANT